MELKQSNDWQPGSVLPNYDGYYCLVYRHSANCNRYAVCFFSTSEGWILPPTFSDFKPFVLGWYPLPGFPDWLVDDVPF